MEKEFFQNLNKAFNNYDKLFEYCCNGAFYPSVLSNYLSTLLKYYITTREDPSCLTYLQLKEFNKEIRNRVPTKNEIDNIMTNGYLSHSFYDEQHFISQYGFAYEAKASKEEIAQRNEIYKCLDYLEKKVAKSPYVEDRLLSNPEEIIQEKYFTTIGDKTIYYATYVPERLYIGPINKDHFYRLPIVVGESKKDYLLRALQYKLDYSKNCDKNTNLKIAERVMDYYTKYPTGIAFLPMQEALKLDFNARKFNNRKSHDLENFYSELSRGRSFIHSMFSKEYEDCPEIGDTGDLVILADDLKDCNLSTITFPDWYNLRQEYLKRMNYSNGTLVTFENCDKADIENYYSYGDIKKYYKSL